MNINIFSYHQPPLVNLGDAIQTIALEQLLTKRGHTVSYRDRDSTLGASKDDTHIANGFLMDARDHQAGSPWHNLHWHPSQARFTAFAGIHIPKKSVLDEVIRTNSRAIPIGARDPWTEALLLGQGAQVELIGCASLTFERYRGLRQGTYTVDVPAREDAIPLTHHVDSIPWDKQHEKATELLALYRTAELVYTSRLHALLPCLAFGTPVVFVDHTPFEDPDKDRRFTLLRTLRVLSNKLFATDVGFISNRYERFLDGILAEAAR